MTISHATKIGLAMLALLCAACSVLADASVWDLLRSGGPSRRGAASHAGVHRGPPADKKKSGGILDEISDTARRLGKQWNSDIKVQGNHTTSFHLESVSGSQAAYQDSSYYGREGFGGTYSNTDMTIQGKIGGVLNFETRYTNSLYGNPNDNRVSLNYATKGLKFDAGDIQGSISGNSLIQFSRSLKGVEIAAEVTKGVKLTTLYSQTKADARTITLNGANRSGPYYVYAGQIVDGSEHVRVNNVDKVKGQDYTLDPYTGELNFLNGLIIHEYDTIAVTFETYGYGEPAGLLSGFRADITSLGNAKIGLTYLSQESGAASGVLSTRTEQFFGYGSAGTPYTLQYPATVTLVRDKTGKVIDAIPISMTVMVGGTLLTFPADYRVDPLLPNQVYTTMAYLSNQILRITYLPQIQNEIAGNRRVYGMDAGVSLGKTGTVVAEYAQSSLAYSTGNVDGGAWQVRGDLALAKDRLRWNWNLRDISQDFTNIESPGFNRNDRGFTTSFDYRASPTLQMSASFEKSKRADYTSSTGTTSVDTSVGLDDYSNASLTANWRIGSHGQLSFGHSSSSTALATGGSSGLNSDTLSATYSLKRVNMDFSFGHTLANASALTESSSGGATTTTLSVYRSDALTSRLGLHWTIASGYSLSTSVSNSQSRDQTGSNSNAQDISLNAELSPLKSLRLSLGYQLQNSGSLSSNSNPYLYGGGTNNGLGGYGSYSGGLTSGSGSTLLGSTFGGTSHSLTADLNYQPSRVLTFDLSLSSSASAGDYLYNSNRDSVAFTTSYNAGERFSINATYNIQNVTYIGTAGGSSSNVIYLNAHTRPVGKLTATLSYQLMTTSGSASTTTTTVSGSGTALYSSGGSNMSSYGLRLEYPVWRQYTLYTEYTSASSTGYLASDQRSLSMGTDIALSKNVHFVTGWRMQQYLSRDPTSGTSSDYRVGSLDADFNLHF